MSKFKASLDKMLERMVSRKLLVWLTATGGLFLGVVPADDWTSLALMYIGTQGALDTVTTFMKARKVEQNE